MPKTIKKTIGNMEFEVRENIPYKLMDDLFIEANNLKSIPEPEPVNFNVDVNDPKAYEKLQADISTHDKIAALRERKSMDLKNTLLKRMIIKPRITEDYLENEATDELWDYSLDILKNLMKAFDERFKNLEAGLDDPLSEDIKKKPMN